MTSDDDVWARLRLMMPRHSCGRRMEPGALDGPALVCVPCAYIETVAPDWAADLAAEARRQTEGAS